MKPTPCLVLEEKRKKQRRITLVKTSFNFNVSHTSKKIERWRLGSSIGEPPNWDYWTIDMSAGLHSKLFTSTFSRAILDEMPWTPGVMKSQSVLWAPAPGSIFRDSSWTLRFFSGLCFFLLVRKVHWISRSGSCANGLRMKGKIGLQAQNQHYQCNQKWNEK